MSRDTMQNYLYNFYLQTEKLLLYRNLLHNGIIKKMKTLLLEASSKNFDSPEIITLYYDICSDLINAAEKKGLSGDLWKEYLIDQVAGDENAFSTAAEKYGRVISDSIFYAAVHDLNILKKFSEMGPSYISRLSEQYTNCFSEDYVPSFQNNYTYNTFYRNKLEELKKYFHRDSPVEELANILARFYFTTGCGITGYYTAFRWTRNGLEGIEHPDPVTLEDIIGYEQQKEFVVKNTEAFIQNKPANNLLLYGARGTGKSSTVKALANKYFRLGLRLVEVPKHQLPSLPLILQHLRRRSRYFIIFIDDLSFDAQETEYKHMKALMEGGVETPPGNVILYATSNRRHLVQEKWSDRESQEGEIHLKDSIQEKLSLADRFGVTVTYLSPDQEDYLEIVRRLADSHGLDIPYPRLRELALQWEKWYNARSGRTARQFINHLLGDWTL